ncbi:MAG: salicylate hydroxylase [Gemmatimonadota bacterium]
MAERGRALVIGGGIGGLAAALGLRRAGWDVRVFEQAPELKEVGAGIALWANGLQALDRLGVGDAVRARGRLHDGGAVRNVGGDVLMGLSATPRDGGGAWLGCMIHRADLLAVLAEAVGPEAVRTGATLVGVAERGGRVVATFRDGSSAEGDALVGADGIRSAVREALHGELPLRYAGYTLWRWVAPFPEGRTLAGETWGSGARFGQAALPGGRAYVYATLDAPPGKRGPRGEKDELRRIFAGWHAPIPELVEAARDEDILRHDCYDLPPLARWGRGRCTLLGDAAHAMTPNLGQGACQALEDAVVLGRWMGREPDAVAALRGYERERRPRAVRFQKRSWSAGVVGQWSHPVAMWVREVLTRRVLSGMQERQMQAMMEVEL